MRVGEIDPRAVGPTNELPKLTPEQAAARTWKPDAATWEAVKERSVEAAATVTITGFAAAGAGTPVSRGQVVIRTSRDPVGAPIFYRDVPLMPSAGEKGVIKPLATAKVPLIAWRLRNVAEARSRLLLTGMHTCANCHSFSRDGKTLGMDLDGPKNDKGLYALVPVQPQTTIRNQDVIAWSSFRGKLGNQLRVGFMSQVSPDGRYVVTTIKPRDTGAEALAADLPLSKRQLLPALLRRELHGLPLPPGLLPHGRDPGLVRPDHRPAAAPARGGRPALRADEQHLEPGRPVPGVRPRRGPGPEAARGARSPPAPTTRTRSRSSTTSTGSRSTTGRAARPSRSGAPRATA